MMVHREGNVLRLALPVGMSFETMSADLNPNCYPALNILAEVLEHYRQTIIEVIGYADAGQVGNHRLPEQRAFEISSYLIEQQLHHERFEIVGLRRYAPSQVEIRLLPLQRSMISPESSEKGLVRSNGFVDL